MEKVFKPQQVRREATVVGFAIYLGIDTFKEWWSFLA